MDNWIKYLSKIDINESGRDEIINLIAQGVENWLETKPDELFSKLYRLDISEESIKSCLKEADFAKAIATQIYERQLQKFISRKENPPQRPSDDLGW